MLHLMKVNCPNDEKMREMITQRRQGDDYQVQCANPLTSELVEDDVIVIEKSILTQNRHHHFDRDEHIRLGRERLPRMDVAIFPRQSECLFTRIFPC